MMISLLDWGLVLLSFSYWSPSQYRPFCLLLTSEVIWLKGLATFRYSPTHSLEVYPDKQFQQPQLNTILAAFLFDSPTTFSRRELEVEIHCNHLKSTPLFLMAYFSFWNLNDDYWNRTDPCYWSHWWSYYSTFRIN